MVSDRRGSEGIAKKQCNGQQLLLEMVRDDLQGPLDSGPFGEGRKDLSSD